MASKYIQKFPVPEGFPEVLHDLAKEILRNQPDDIIEFSALYFKCLQENIVLDYPKKGRNIPCDFKANVPKISTREEMNEGKRRITREDEADHAKAVEKSKHINHVDPVVDAAKVEVVPENREVEVVIPEKKEIEVVVPEKKEVEVVVPEKNEVEVVVPEKKEVELVIPEKKEVEVVIPQNKVEQLKVVESRNENINEENRNTQDNELLKSLSTSFVQDLMNKKIENYQSKNFYNTNLYLNINFFNR